MELRVWRSFSCNNSSSYYMVASFDSPDAASASATELAEFLEAHAHQIDEAIEKNDYSDNLEPSEAEKALAAKHGFETEGYLRWGDEALHYWIPTVSAIGKEVVLYHAYCGGFGGSIPRYFKAVGATPGAESRSNPLLSVRLTVPEGEAGAAISRELGVYLDGLRQTAEDEEGWVFNDSSNPPPWGAEATEDMEFECGVPFPAFRDTHQIGFALEIARPSGIEEMTKYLDARGVADYHLGIDRYADLARFRAIAAAECGACQSREALRFVAAGESDAPTDQMLCAGCGGMFELELAKPGEES